MRPLILEHTGGTRSRISDRMARLTSVSFQIIDHLVILFATASGNTAISALCWAIIDAKCKFRKGNYLRFIEFKLGQINGNTSYQFLVSSKNMGILVALKLVFAQ